jgi:thymidine kinase
MSGTLDIILGPMFSGKSFELIRRIRLLKILEKKFMVIKPLIDNRYSKKNVICTHNYDKEDCFCVQKLEECFNHDLSKIDSIFIDEGQFFPDLKECVIKFIEEFNINVIITGLDGDFQRKPFGQILDLIPYADTCIKKNALCKACKDGTKAIFSHRINKDSNKDQILVGSVDSYIPVCRNHYLLLNQISVGSPIDSS